MNQMADKMNWDEPDGKDEPDDRQDEPDILGKESWNKEQGESSLQWP